MTLESDLNPMLRTLSKKELNAYTVTWNEAREQGNTGHVYLDWDPMLQSGGEWPSSSSPAGPSWPTDCTDYGGSCTDYGAAYPSDCNGCDPTLDFSGFTCYEICSFVGSYCGMACWWNVDHWVCNCCCGS